MGSDYTPLLRRAKSNSMQVKTMAEYAANNESPDVLFFVGCAGSFDQRAQKVTRAFATILEKAGIKFAILGKEEGCTGDPARRAGNEFLFQMMAYNNINLLNAYGVKKIVTSCPHCFNTLKNEYPALGGNYEVLHHTTFLNQLIADGKIRIKKDNAYASQAVTYHDSCYLGRGNGIYEAPREVLAALQAEVVEMKRCKSNGMCCGAGGAQMFKEEEKGSTRVNFERAHQALETGSKVVASNCPFCMTMLTDGIKNKEQEEHVLVTMPELWPLMTPL